MGIFNILRGFENLVAEILLWLVFIPKTLFKIIADPNWVTSYVEEELKDKGEERFDSYISPILLFLVTSLVLFVIFNTIESGTQKVATTERLVNEIKGSQGTLAGLGFLSLPLLFALATELFRGAGLTRKGIQRIFYIQCYYFSPLTLSLFAFILLDELLPEGDSLIGQSSLWLLVPVFIWFLIVEVKVIAQELNGKTLKAIGVFSLTIILIMGGMFLLEIFVGSETDEAFEGGVEVIVQPPLDSNDLYSISVRGYENSAGDYRLIILVDPPPCTEGSSPNERLLTYDECVVGSVTSDASPVWVFRGSEGDNIIVLIEPDPELDIVVDLFDETRQLIQVADDSFEGGPEVIVQTLPNTGEFSINVHGYENSAGDYDLTLIEQSPCIEGSSIKGGILNYGECVTGQVAEGAFSTWAFQGSEGDDITVLVEPDQSLDATVDVLDKSGRSIQGEAQAFNFIINFIGYFYLLVIGVAVLLGFWSIFRKPKETSVQKEEGTE